MILFFRGKAATGKTKVANEAKLYYSKYHICKLAGEFEIDRSLSLKDMISRIYKVI